MKINWVIELITHKTIYALMQITEKIQESIDKGKFECGIFIDIRMATLG